MAGERVHHEHLSLLFNLIFNLIERFGAFRKSANEILVLVLLSRSETGEKKLDGVVSWQ